VTATSDEFLPDGTGVKIEKDGCSIRSSDTYRKYLAGYVNFATIGLEIIAIAGALFILADWLIERSAKKSPADEKTGNILF